MHLVPRLRALVACLLAALPLLAQEKDLSGHWTGEIRLPTGKLELDLDFTRKPDGGFSGDVTIPAQNAKDLPLSGIRVDGRSVVFAIEGVPGEPIFDGEADEAWAAITGDFSQGGKPPLRFKLQRATAAGPDIGKNLAGFDAWIEETRAKWHVPAVAVAIVHKDQVLLAKGFGLRDTERKLPATADTLFAIGSSTKAFTTFVLASLVEEGKLAWDQPVRTWMPEFRLKDEGIAQHLTPRDLVTHRSGLPRHDMVWYNNHESTRAEMVARLAWLEASKDLRTTFQYNNLMYLTAGCVAERVGQKSWEELVYQRIFQPLGMARSNFSVVDSQKDQADDFALPYRRKDGEVQRMGFRDISTMGPAGSINSTANDMVHWLRVHLGGGRVGERQFLPRGAIAELHTAHMAMGQESSRPEVVPIGYGLGWFNDVWRGHRRVHHGGNIDGFSALVCLVPSERLGFVALSNLNGTPLPGLIVQHGIDRALGLPARDWSAEALARQEKAEAADKTAKAGKKALRKTGTQAAHPLAEYCGDYEHPGYGVMAIQLAEGGLTGSFNGMTAPLTHWHFEVFQFEQGGNDFALERRQLLFETGFDGAVGSLRMAIEPAVKEAVFTRRAEARMRDPQWLQALVGEYDLSGQTCRVTRKGSTLTASLPGQPNYELVPRRGTTFELKGMAGFRASFELDESGNATAFVSEQPDGVYRMPRKKAAQDQASAPAATTPAATRPAAEVVRLHTGFQFTEGPAADPEGNLYFSDVPANRIWRVDLEGKLELFLENSQGCNGLMHDGGRRLLACQGGARRLIAIDQETKAIEVLADAFEGKPFNRPNDLVVDRSGGVWFTDPVFGRAESVPAVMGVYYVAPDRTVTRVISDVSRPNGILLSPDEQTLYVLPSGHEQLLAWPLQAGRPGPRRSLCDLTKPERGAASGDGLTVDREGTLYLTVPPAKVVQVVSPEGRTLETIPIPEAPANCAFGGRDLRTLFVTARTSLYTVRRAVPGHRFGPRR